jgi:DNA invertase Pin-like site-specific DNA recombinase
MARRLADSPDEILDRLLTMATSPGKRASLTMLAPSGEQSMVARDRPLRVAAYCRYSSAMQNDGWSIPMQHSAFDKEVEAQGRVGATWEVDFFDEPAKSATDRNLAKRVVFLQMMRRALAGEYDIVAVYKLNRFSRSEIVTLLALEELQRAGVGFVSLQEKFDCTTPAGWIGLRLAITLAESDNREKGKMVADGKQERAMAGLYAARVPFGYRKSVDAVREALSRVGADPRAATKAIGQAPAEPDTGPDGGTWDGLQRLFALMREGLTDYEVKEVMNREGKWRPPAPGGGRAERGVWTRKGISWIRRNRFYRPFQPGDPCGTVLNNGREYRGTHVAAISWEEWQSIQQIAVGRRRGWMGYNAARRPEPYTAEFRGLAVCSECGGALYVWRTIYDKAKDGVTRAYERYVCKASDRGVTCSQERKWARVEDVRAAWVEWLRAHPFDPQWEQIIRARGVQLARYGERGATTERVRDQAQQIAKLRRQYDAVTHLYAEGEIERPEYERRITACREALSRLESVGVTVEQHVQRLVSAVNVLQEAPRLWEHMTLAERQAAAARLIEPKGLPLRLFASKGYSNRWTAPGSLPPSCELGEVILRPAFREAMETVALREAIVWRTHIS